MKQDLCRALDFSPERGTGKPDMSKMLQKHENINVRRKKTSIKKKYIYNSTKWAIFLFYKQLRRSAGYEFHFAYFPNFEVVFFVIV